MDNGNLQDSDFISNGYKHYLNNGRRRERRLLDYGNFCECLFQKRVDDGTSTLYFIDVYKWMFPSPAEGPSYCAEVRLYQEKNVEFDLNLHAFSSVNELEEFYQRAYKSLGCVPKEVST